MNRGMWALAVLVLLLAVAGWWLTRPPVPPPPAPAPPPEVLAALARGVNLSNWLQHGVPAEGARYAPDNFDWRLIRALGFRHARILVDPDAFAGRHGLPRPEALKALHDAVAAAAKLKLLVVVGLQLPPEAKARLKDGEVERQALGGLWRVLAASLKDFTPQQLALEPLNEPELEDAGDSQRLLTRLVTEIRTVLPAHTLVVSGHRYAGVEELTQMTPLQDANIVYSFHFYEPHNFTHQGATWGTPLWRQLRNFPYPSTPERVAPLLAGAPTGEAADALRWHGDERWDQAKIAGIIGRAARWGQNHNVPVWCSEFGVLKKRAAPADRRAWLRDVRAALEQHKIPWTHWDYAGDFGVVTGVRGKRIVDRGTAEALGLEAE